MFLMQLLSINLIFFSSAASESVSRINLVPILSLIKKGTLYTYSIPNKKILNYNNINTVS